MINKIMNEALRKLAESYIGSGVESKQKLLVSSEDAEEGARSANQLAQSDDDGLIGRTVSRISHQEIQNQKNLEDIISLADQDLACKPDKGHGGEMDEGWFSYFSKYAMGVTNEDMKKGWAKILAGEIRIPDSFSLRTLNLMSMLSRKEAEVIRKIAQYVVYTSDEEEAYILSSKKIEEIEFSDILLLGELRIIDSSSELSLNVNRKDEEGFNFLLKNHCTGLFFSSEREKMFFRIYKFTTIGKEMMKLNDDVELNLDYAREYAEILIKNDPTMTITCSKILKLTETNVDLDEEHPYFRIGTKIEKTEEVSID